MDWLMYVLDRCDPVGSLCAGDAQIVTPFPSSPEAVISEDLVITRDYFTQQSWEWK